MYFELGHGLEHITNHVAHIMSLLDCDCNKDAQSNFG